MKYGWRPSAYDPRNYQLSVRLGTPAAPPPRVDLRPVDPIIFDQGSLGSCTDNAVAALHHFVQVKEGRTPFVPSRLMLYYNARVLEHNVSWDAGSEPASVLSTLHHDGVCSETLWPYDIGRYTERPPDAAYTAGQYAVALRYEQLADWPFSGTGDDPTGLVQMKSCLASGFPFVFGFPVYGQFETNNGGLIEMSGPTNSTYLGGHCAMAIGYDDNHRTGDFLCKNSWGNAWGFEGGYFWLPYDYMRYIARDKWTLSFEGVDSPLGQAIAEVDAKIETGLHSLGVN